MSCMHENDLKTLRCHEECKIISYEAMKFVRNVLVLHCKVLPMYPNCMAFFHLELHVSASLE